MKTVLPGLLFAGGALVLFGSGLQAKIRNEDESPTLFASAASLFMKMKGFHPDRSCRRNRIITVRAPGMAAGNTAECQPKPFEGAMDLDRFNGIDRTGGDMAAGSREERGNGIFIKIDESQKHPA